MRRLTSLALQRGRRHRHGQIGLTRPGRADAEDDPVSPDGVDVRLLARGCAGRSAFPCAVTCTTSSWSSSMRVAEPLGVHLQTGAHVLRGAGRAASLSPGRGRPRPRGPFHRRFLPVTVSSVPRATIVTPHASSIRRRCSSRRPKSPTADVLLSTTNCALVNVSLKARPSPPPLSPPHRAARHGKERVARSLAMCRLYQKPLSVTSSNTRQNCISLNIAMSAIASARTVTTTAGVPSSSVISTVSYGPSTATRRGASPLPAGPRQRREPAPRRGPRAVPPAPVPPLRR